VIDRALFFVALSPNLSPARRGALRLNLMALVDKSIGEARKQIVIEMNWRQDDIFEKMINH